jgi:hypothetical protein
MTVIINIPLDWLDLKILTVHNERTGVPCLCSLYRKTIP